MKEYSKELPIHIEKYIGENDLYLKLFEGNTLVLKNCHYLVHGAYT